MYYQDGEVRSELTGAKLEIIMMVIMSICLEGLLCIRYWVTLF